VKRNTLIVLAVLGVILAGWLLTGGLGRAVEGRIESQLVARGVPQPMANCMAHRMATRLTLGQLRQIEELKPQDGETNVPTSVAEFLERVRRIRDSEVIEVTASSAAVCAFTAR
jgi:hypothetical protein